jgi:hypothetical protein
MNLALEMASEGTIYLQNFIRISSGLQVIVRLLTRGLL